MKPALLREAVGAIPAILRSSLYGAVLALLLVPSVPSGFTGAIAGNRRYSTGATEVQKDHYCTQKPKIYPRNKI